MIPPTLPWHVEAHDGHIVWHDLACRTCRPCRTGLPGRCVAPLDPSASTDDRVHRARAPEHVDAALAATAALAMDLVHAAAPLGPAVLLTGSGPRLVDVGHLLRAGGAAHIVLHGDVPPGSRLPVAGESEVRSAFAHARPAQRPDVVVSLDGDLGTASRLVRRGGAIGSTAPNVVEPSFAAVVQRELIVLAPGDPSAAFQFLEFETAVDGREIVR